MDFEQITDEEKEALHIAYVSESNLIFKQNNFCSTIEFDKYDDSEFSVEVIDADTYYFTKEQLAFIVKWISYSR